MACRGFFECLLKPNSPGDDPAVPPSSEVLIQLGRPMMMAVSLGADNIFDNLPKAWHVGFSGFHYVSQVII